MTRGEDDRTQVQAVTLRTEAELLRSWMAKRDAVAEQRRQGPLEALRHRHGLLEREVPRLELDVTRLEKRLAKPLPGVASVFLTGLLTGLLLALGAMVWVVAVAVLTPGAHVDSPSRVAAIVATVALVVVVRVSQEARS